MSNITKLQNARIAKKMGSPLTLEFVDGVTSDGTNEQCSALDSAYYDFQRALGNHLEGQSRGRWKTLKRKLAIFATATDAAREFWAANRKVDPSAEVVGALAFRADQFIAWWQQAIEVTESGEPLQVNPGDIPKYRDD